MVSWGSHTWRGSPAKEDMMSKNMGAENVHWEMRREIWTLYKNKLAVVEVVKSPGSTRANEEWIVSELKEGEGPESRALIGIDDSFDKAKIRAETFVKETFGL